MRRMFSLNCERRLRIYKMGLQMHSLTRGQPRDKIVPGKSYLCSYLNIYICIHTYIHTYRYMGPFWTKLCQENLIYVLIWTYFHIYTYRYMGPFGRKWSQGILIYVHIQIYKAYSPPLSVINLNWTSIFSNTFLATPVALHLTLVKWVSRWVGRVLNKCSFEACKLVELILRGYRG